MRAKRRGLYGGRTICSGRKMAFGSELASHGGCLALTHLLFPNLADCLCRSRHSLATTPVHTQRKVGTGAYLYPVQLYPWLEPPCQASIPLFRLLQASLHGLLCLSCRTGNAIGSAPLHSSLLCPSVLQQRHQIGGAACIVLYTTTIGPGNCPGSLHSALDARCPLFSPHN